jgi:hypothetical protein
MRREQKAWLFLEKSDETRVSQGIDGYQDRTGEIYQYDSLVPNHRNVAEGDIVIIRRENLILGYGRIGSIEIFPTQKIHRRCPSCKSTDTRERKNKFPKWKCGACASEFVEPLETLAQVSSYSAQIEDFMKFGASPGVALVKAMAVSGGGIKSQLSMIELDLTAAKNLIGSSSNAYATSSRSQGGQGFGLSADERKAVELHAMRAARAHYERLGWTVTDTSASAPYDYRAVRDKEIRYIEVKGTTGTADTVILTSNEVEHAQRNFPNCALLVISEIQITKSEGQATAGAGRLAVILDPWKIDESSLVATQFRYTLRRTG